MATKIKKRRPRKHEKFPGYPIYPSKDDIFEREKEEADLDPENPKVKKSPNETPDRKNSKDFEEDVSGDDLDVPGAELDDMQEATGSEDEENNHYSIGGDNHHNLEEGLWE
jgi:hypothetical protein